MNESWFILSAIYLFVLVWSWAEVVAHVSNDERGTVFVLIHNGCYFCLHLKAGGLCFWRPVLPEGQLVPMIWRFASAVFRMTEVCLPSVPKCTSEQNVARAMHLRTQTIVPPFVFVEVHHL